MNKYDDRHMKEQTKALRGLAQRTLITTLPLARPLST